MSESKVGYALKTTQMPGNQELRASNHCRPEQQMLPQGWVGITGASCLSVPLPHLRQDLLAQAQAPDVTEDDCINS